MANKVFTTDTWAEFTSNMSDLSGKVKSTNIAYGTCSTAAATAAKVITVSGDYNWNLTVGSFITVLFSNTNTASNPTFNVNGTGAKNVYYTTSKIATSNLSYAGYKNRPMNFIYDGTNYVFIGWGVDSNTDTKVDQAELTSNSDRSILLASNNTTASATTGTYKSTKLKYNPSTNILTAGTFKGALDGTATKATNADTATYATKAGTATYATSANKATTASKAGTATYATNSGTSTYSSNSAKATTASKAGTATTLSGLTATVTELNYVDGVTSSIQTQLNSKATTVELTQAEYDALPDTKYTDGNVYAITDAGEEFTGASDIEYDNSISKIGASNVQLAIDLLNEKVDDEVATIEEQIATEVEQIDARFNEIECKFPQMKVLWENPDKTATFAAQDITVEDISQFDFIGVEYCLTTSYPTQVMTSFASFSSGGLICVLVGGSNQGNRKVTFTNSTTITFDAGSYSGSTNNKAGVPYKIYGIKFA